MGRDLEVSTGGHSETGRKEVNQDFHGLIIPEPPLLRAKGVAVALADGIGSSDVSQIAAESAVKGFLTDYYCTSDAWSVKQSAHRVLAATNSWLHAQNQRSPFRYEKDRGYVCTFSAMVVKSATAHLFHVGDSRIYRLAGNSLEQLTTDHRVNLAGGQSYLGRALGVNQQVEVDYLEVPVEVGDTFLLTTDGVHEHLDSGFAAAVIAENADDLDAAARVICAEALRLGSNDNLTLQIVRIDHLPAPEAGEAVRDATGLPLPPDLEPRMMFDGYRILRQLHASSRSHVFLARDGESGDTVVLKVPSVDLCGDEAYLKRFLMEDWIARRINSPHVLRPHSPGRRRNYLYVATEYVNGQTLAQWMVDNPQPSAEVVRAIAEQIAQGLRAFHRMEMLHQDLRPENIMIDTAGTVKIIDFGSAQVAGIVESAGGEGTRDILGSLQYTAPEYFLGEGGTPRSDLFALGVLTYQMLTGRLPYGAAAARATTRAAQRRLVYASALDETRAIPAWIDDVLKKAVHPDPVKRTQELSEFVYDLRHPNRDYLAANARPLMERNPVLFWKCVSLGLLWLVFGLLYVVASR